MLPSVRGNCLKRHTETQLWRNSPEDLEGQRQGGETEGERGCADRHPLYDFREELNLARRDLSEQFVEKSFLYLLAFSLLLHVGIFGLVLYWPREQKQAPEPTFIDLKDVTELKSPEPVTPPERAIPSDQRRRVTKEAAPRGNAPVDIPAARPSPAVPKPTEPSPSAPSVSRPSRQPSAAPPASSEQVSPGFSANELVRRKPTVTPQSGEGGAQSSQPRLMPSASRMAKLEEQYRRRFADDIADGDTRFLNTDDIQFGSFLRRFETAVYGVWRYPQEAAMKGIEGVTPVKITFNRNGEIVKVQLLESSGSRVLDTEVFRTLRLIGPMGNLPKAYPKDEFNLIAFFQYGGARGRLR